MPKPSFGDSYPWLATEKNTFWFMSPGSKNATKPFESVSYVTAFVVCNSTIGTRGR